MEVLPPASSLILADYRQGASSSAYPRRVPKPDLWLEAFKQVQNKEKGAFRQLQVPAKVEALKALIGVAEKEQQRCEKERWKLDLCGREYILSDLARKIATWIQEYMRVVGIAASSNPIQLGLSWAAMRVLLNVLFHIEISHVHKTESLPLDCCLVHRTNWSTSPLS